MVEQGGTEGIESKDWVEGGGVCDSPQLEEA